jgi:hypothetical protein
MSNFLFDLATNLAILAALLIACHLCNLARPDLALNGGYTYLLLAATALVFDATLTFCVFADAPSRYGKFSTPDAFVERACAYTLVCALALYCARCLRIRMEKASANHALVVRTSPYSESHLPMCRPAIESSTAPTRHRFPSRIRGGGAMPPALR